MPKKSKEQGGEAFECCYGGIFGDRWEALKEAMRGEPFRVEYTEGLSAPYTLDAASVYAALSLAPEGGSKALDMCAAPGGKSLVIASLLGEGGSLVSNERSGERRARLKRVLDAHLRPEARARVLVTGHDAARWCLHETCAYDRILLDAPCSSERHVMGSPSQLALWTPTRTKRLAIDQWALASSAFRALKPGGILVYSTCALSELENEGVARRILEKCEGEAMALPPREIDEARDKVADPPLIEAISALRLEPCHPAGVMLLPDASSGAGPMYVARFMKR